MKKIGIVTFHRAKNYGAVLQAYALQKTVESLGADCEIVDYKCENIDRAYKPFQFSKSDPVKSLIKSILLFRKRSRRIKRFDSFYSGRLKLSDKTYTSEQMAQCNSQYDAFISGSDQVWGPGKEGVDPDSVYFLGFADDEKKFSYSASFGTDKLSNEKTKVMAKLLGGFQTLSVREKSAVELVRKINQKNAYCHIDPTFLLSSDEWGKIAQPPTLSKYILVFNVKPVKSLIRFAEKLSAEKNLPVVYITDNPQKKRKGFTYVSSPTVEEFLGYFQNASYTVTNSFHGTAFSVIFHRNLFVEFETQRGQNDRAKSLLEIMGIDREIKNAESKETEIDWNKVDEIISQKQDESKKYLTTIMEA